MFWYIQKSCSRQQLFYKKVLFNKFHCSFWWIQKRLIAFYKKGILEIIYCLPKITIMLLYAAKKQLNPIQDGPFRSYSQMGGGGKPPIPKIFHTYPKMMKLGKVISYIKNIKKIYKSRDKTLEFCWHQHFLAGNQ